MKRWDLIRKWKDWKGRYKISCKTYDNEKALRKAIAVAVQDIKLHEKEKGIYKGTLSTDNVSYSIRVWDLVEDYSMDAYITEQKRANQLGTVFGEVSADVDQFGTELSRIFSKDFPTMVEEWEMISKTDKKEMSAFFTTHRIVLQLYPTLDGEDYVAWWALLLRHANYVKLTGERLYVFGRYKTIATPEMSEKFSEVLKNKRKKK